MVEHEPGAFSREEIHALETQGYTLKLREAGYGAGEIEALRIKGII